MPMLLVPAAADCIQTWNILTRVMGFQQLSMTGVTFSSGPLVSL